MLDQIKPLDFFVIGAQKSGTTSLYYYLNAHRDIDIHNCKELTFVIDKEEPIKRYAQMIKKCYANAQLDKCWGAVAPHCMCDPRVPSRLRSLMPNGKLIAILRDPIDRLLSHYNMLCLREMTYYDINQLISKQLKCDNLLQQRLAEYKLEEEENNIIVWGEYGRILQTFSDFFKGKLLVVFLEELSTYPILIYKQLCNFIDVDDSFIPKNVGQKYHASQQSQLNNIYIRLRNIPIVRALWRSMVPEHKRIEYAYKYSLGIKNTQRFEISSQVRDYLIEHYLMDIKILESIIHRQVPWPRFSTVC